MEQDEEFQTKLSLKKDPTNKFNSRAVGVYYDTTELIGYIPDTDLDFTHAFLDDVGEAATQHGNWDITNAKLNKKEELQWFSFELSV